MTSEPTDSPAADPPELDARGHKKRVVAYDPTDYPPPPVEPKKSDKIRENLPVFAFLGAVAVLCLLGTWKLVELLWQLLQWMGLSW